MDVLYKVMGVRSYSCLSFVMRVSVDFSGATIKSIGSEPCL